MSVVPEVEGQIKGGQAPATSQDDSQNRNWQQVIQDIGQILGTFQNAGGGGGQVISPPRVGQLLPPMNIKYDPSRATGAMNPPIPGPVSPGYSQPPGGAQMQSMLQPKAAAVYSGVQGVAQAVSQWAQKREMKQQSEAANIAMNLMRAVESGDSATASEILNDPKATKILNKVYKGWLTPAPKAKTATKPDAELQGFEQGIQRYLQGKAQQPPPMPRQLGGYMLPSASPTQMQKAVQDSAMTQLFKQRPELALAVTPREAAEANIKLNEMKIEQEFRQNIAKNYLELYRTAAQQEAELERAITVAKIHGASMESVEQMREQARKNLNDVQFGQKKQLLDIVRGAKGGDPARVQIQMLQAQLRQAESQYATVTSSYKDLLKSGNDDAAKAMLDLQKKAQNQIDNINRQMDDLKTTSDPAVQDALKYIFGP